MEFGAAVLEALNIPVGGRPGFRGRSGVVVVERDARYEYQGSLEVFDYVEFIVYGVAYTFLDELEVRP